MLLTRNLLIELDLGILIFYFNKIKILLICRFTVRASFRNVAVE